MESTYLALHEAALALAPWAPWRERALEALDDRTARRWGTSVRELRICLLLAEGQAQRALDMAQGHIPTLSSRTLTYLLTEAEALDPTATLPICEQLIETAIARPQHQGYRVAVDLLPTLQRIYRHQGDPTRFDLYLAQLRQRYQRKRNLIELLDQRFPATATPPTR
ncbi:hypothetical protein [Xanthomonas albilineans]|uniref:hypothetical protein n=1 Tax=Xanthomonas albilineans TaxID=29447 RepID=UPI0006973A81|nr:hypothetical protein [Xanthomonas albilineans]